MKKKLKKLGLFVDWRRKKPSYLWYSKPSPPEEFPSESTIEMINNCLAMGVQRIFVRPKNDLAYDK